MTGFHAVSYILPNQALSRIFRSGYWSISVRIQRCHMSPRGRGISHVSNAENCEHLQTAHRQIAPPTAMQCVRTPSRDYDHAAVRMNEIGEEKVKVKFVSGGITAMELCPFHQHRVLVRPRFLPSLT